jgi:preprotein translocase subunit YajC
VQGVTRQGKLLLLLLLLMMMMMMMMMMTPQYARPPRVRAGS